MQYMQHIEAMCLRTTITHSFNVSRALHRFPCMMLLLAHPRCQCHSADMQESLSLCTVSMCIQITGLMSYVWTQRPLCLVITRFSMTTESKNRGGEEV